MPVIETLAVAAMMAAQPMPAYVPAAPPASETMRVTPAQAPAVANWSGFYLGANAGMGWGEGQFDALSGLLFPGYNDNISIEDALIPAGAGTFPAAKGSDSAFVGGGQIGYSWQIDQIVFGLEGDLMATDLTNSASTTAARTVGGRTQTVTGFYAAEFGWLGSVRGKVGIANGNFLYYATGGLAFAEAELHTRFSVVNAAGNTPLTGGNSASDVSDRVGWTAGVGAEWAFTGGWSLGAEYRHTSLGDQMFNFGDVDPSLASQPDLKTKVPLELDQVVLKVNYRFMGP